MKPQAADTPGSVILGREPEVQVGESGVCGAASGSALLPCQF